MRAGPADAPIHEVWKPVTLKQLLTDTAGAPANFARDTGSKRPALGPERTLARREAVLSVLAEKPTYPPGEKQGYFNIGYTIAAVMAEQTTGQTWEDLVKREVFEPLKLTTAGFGPPKSPDDTLPQPRGHRPRPGSKIAVDDETDNTPIIGPAGSVHMSLADLSTYTTEHLRGERGKGQLLSAETYMLLHAPVLGHYACGWIRDEPTSAIPYPVYWRNGSNTLWYTLVAFIPEKNMVFAVTSNDGDITSAEAVAWEIVNFAVKDIDIIAAADFPKVAPFAAVRWQQTQPEIQLDDEWFKLVSLNKLPAADIVAFSQKTYGDKWQKRFEEVLVELLTRMGHPPEDKVTLKLQSLTSSETQVRESVPMTEANRRAVRDAAQSRSTP